MNRTSTVTLTRTGDTNQYTAGDVLGANTSSGGAVLKFVDIAASFADTGGHILITDANLRIDVTSVPSGMTSFRLHLYDASPASALADNAAWDLPSGDRANYLGYVDLGTPVDVGSTLYVQNTGVNKRVLLTGPDMWAYLVTNGTYTPSSAAVKQIRLHTVAL